MLKPLLAGFVNLHYQDSLAAVLVSAGAAFVWDWRVPVNNAFEQMHGTQFAVYWGVWTAGILLALLERVYLSRGIRLVPDNNTFARQFVVSAVVFLTWAWYAETIEDPAHALGNNGAFPVGALLSWCLMLVALLVVEAAENMIGVPGRDYRPGVSENVTTAVVCSVFIAADLMIFLNGWAVVLLLGGAMLFYLGAGYALRRLADTPTRRPVARSLFSPPWW